MNMYLLYLLLNISLLPSILLSYSISPRKQILNYLATQGCTNTLIALYIVDGAKTKRNYPIYCAFK